MAAFAVCGSLGVRAPFCSVKSGAPLRTVQQKKRWRAGADSMSEWRRECGELRVQVHELRGALMRDEVLLLELESLVSLLALARARDGEVSGFVEIGDEDAKPELEISGLPTTVSGDDEDEVYKDAVILSELRSEELRSKQEGLSTMRRLKTLNVHEYVHNALRESHLRSWLNSRGIAE